MTFGPRGIRHATHGVRRLSDDHLARLCAILAREGYEGARRLLGTSSSLLKNARSGATFRVPTVQRIEAAIDRHEPPPAAEERAS